MALSGEKRKINMEGYFTIEATMILSFVFGVIFLIVFLGFYQYDKCIITQDAYRIALRGSQMKTQQNDVIQNEINIELENWYYEKYIACTWENKKAKITSKEISIEMQIKLNTPFLFKNLWGNEKPWQVKVIKTSNRINPVDVVKKCRILEKIKENEGDKGG